MNFESQMAQALEAARRFEGATAPNPPVGAVVTDEHGAVLSVGAHQKAGTPHAEVHALDECRKNGAWNRRHTIVVTLEPCNHVGRTGACVDAILAAGVRRVVIGARDPNPKVRGGIERLEAAGIEVVQGVRKAECESLVRSFLKWIQTGLPWVTVKTAWTEEGSMVPPPGQKTFTSPESLLLSHQLRRRADAILTGSGTVLADLPEFTVRHLPDIEGKTRWLVVLDRRKRVPHSWVKAAQGRGFRVKTDLNLKEALSFLGQEGCLEVLVEAGLELSAEILGSGIWDEHVMIRKRAQNSEKSSDEVVFHLRSG